MDDLDYSKWTWSHRQHPIGHHQLTAASYVVQSLHLFHSNSVDQLLGNRLFLPYFILQVVSAYVNRIYVRTRYGAGMAKLVENRALTDSPRSELNSLTVPVAVQNPQHRDGFSLDLHPVLQLFSSFLLTFPLQLAQNIRNYGGCGRGRCTLQNPALLGGFLVSKFVVGGTKISDIILSWLRNLKNICNVVHNRYSVAAQPTVHRHLKG